MTPNVDIRLHNAALLIAEARRLWPPAHVVEEPFDPLKTHDVEVRVAGGWFAFALKVDGRIGVSVDARTPAEVDADPWHNYGVEAEAWFDAPDDAVEYVHKRLAAARVPALQSA